MGVFDDKKFEELDWISQATEPIDSELNDILSKIPDEIELNFDTYLAMIGDSWSLELSLDSAIYHLIRSNTAFARMSWDSRNAINKCFSFVIEGQPEINFETRTINNGLIKIIKQSSTMDEKVLESMLGREGIRAVRDMYLRSDSISRINEIMELLGKCDSGLRTRSPRRKRWLLTERLSDLFKTNEWNIKDTTLANKVGYWIADYVKEGNLAAMSNFCRLKVMTHKGQPIYSMTEVE